jgi:NADPH:quinone reductase
VEAGRLRPFIDVARFTLETAPDAYRHLASSEARGEIVIDISDPRGQ